MGTRRTCAVLTFPDRVDIIVPGKPRLFQENLPERTITFTWQEVTQVMVFKRDIFSVDLICMVFELNGKETIEVNEEMKGWKTLVEAVPIYLPGALTQGEWWEKVAWPAFELCLTHIYPRPQA
jgi:hypothetical protein